MFGNRFNQILKILAISQADLAKALKLSPAAIHKIRNNKTNPSATTLLSLVNKFNFSYDWIMEGKGDVFKSNSTDKAINSQSSTYNIIIQELITINKNLVENNTKLTKANAKLSQHLESRNE